MGLTGFLALAAAVLLVGLPAARAGSVYPIQVINNILYNQGVNNNPEVGDLYLPVGIPAGTLIPAIVVIHGGDWSTKSGRGKNYKDVEITSQYLAEHGIAAFAIDYFLYNPYDPFVGAWPQNLMDIKTSIQFLRVMGGAYGINPNQIGVEGTSAGAQLAALSAMTSAAHGGYEPTAPYPGVSTGVQAAFLMYCPCTDISGNGKIPSWLGPNATYQTQLDATPSTYVRAGLAPIMLTHGDADTDVPIQEAYDFQVALSEAGVLPGPGQVTWLNTSRDINYSITPGLIIMHGLGHGYPIADNGKHDGFDYDLRPNMGNMFNLYLPLQLSQN